MKRIVCLMLLLSLLLSLTACGVYHEGSQPSRVVEASRPADITSDEVFSVTLLLDGAPISENAGFYAQYLKMEIYAQWTDGYSYYIAKFDENGVAAATGLDGNFKVTLSAVPDDYVYNINGYEATSDEPKIQIDLYRILYGEGPGTGLYYPYIKELSNQGVYEITVNSPDEVVFCRFMPSQSGIYTIESWESVSEDNINPKADVYRGSVAFATFEATINDGGAESESGYTKNFKYEESVDESEVGNVFIFGISATSKDGQYPIKVKVSVLKTGELKNRYYKQTMVPTEVVRQAPSFSGSFLSTAYDYGGRMLYDSDLCRLWPVAEGGDGYYHLYDEEKYAATNGWGPTLYADLDSFARNEKITITTSDKKFLDYRMFLRGFESLAEYRLVDVDFFGNQIWGSELCSGNCTCAHQELSCSLSNQSTVKIYACLDGCEQCNEECITVSQELWGLVGYCEGANSDGCYPITEELKDFLQAWAEGQNLFCDGSGELELQGYDADQDSMWLWAAGYYSDDPGGQCKMGAVIADCFTRNPNVFPSVS